MYGDIYINSAKRYTVEAGGHAVEHFRMVQDAIQYVHDNWVEGEDMFVEIVDNVYKFVVAQFFDDDPKTAGIRLL